MLPTANLCRPSRSLLVTIRSSRLSRRFSSRATKRRRRLGQSAPPPRALRARVWPSRPHPHPSGANSRPRLGRGWPRACAPRSLRLFRRYSRLVAESITASTSLFPLCFGESWVTPRAELAPTDRAIRATAPPLDVAAQAHLIIPALIGAPLDQFRYDRTSRRQRFARLFRIIGAGPSSRGAKRRGDPEPPVPALHPWIASLTLAMTSVARLNRIML